MRGTAARGDPVLHAPGQGRGSDCRGVSRPWRAHLQPRFASRSSTRSSRDRTDGVAATDLTLCVRLRVSSSHSKLSLASKFGVAADEASAAADGHPPGRRCARHLLPRRSPGDEPAGLCRSPGAGPRRHRRRRRSRSMSSMSAAASRRSIRAWSRRPLDAYFDVINRAFEALPISYSAELWCEPGRALSAEYASVLVRVEARKDDELYINDGAYGALFDAAHIGWRFPVALVRETPIARQDDGFSFYGPTCDDMDFMRGPFELPGRYPGRRLYRSRHARRLWLGDAHRLQRLHRRSTTVIAAMNRWHRSMVSRNAHAVQTSSRCKPASVFEPRCAVSAVHPAHPSARMAGRGRRIGVCRK